MGKAVFFTFRFPCVQKIKLLDSYFPECQDWARNDSALTLR